MKVKREVSTDHSLTTNRRRCISQTTSRSQGQKSIILTRSVKYLNFIFCFPHFYLFAYSQSDILSLVSTLISCDGLNLFSFFFFPFSHCFILFSLPFELHEFFITLFPHRSCSSSLCLVFFHS